MKTLLITGGAGFIGANFIHYWIETHPEDRVVNLDALTYAGNLENLASVAQLPQYRFVHGDICNTQLVSQLFDQEKIDTVINFAAESDVDRSILGPRAFVQTNINGTFSLLEAARKAWHGNSNNCRFLHVSTDEVYGSLAADDPAFTESTAYAPNSPYAASKAASDHLVRAYYHTYGLPVLTTNCSNNYGPYQHPEKLIPLLILNAVAGEPLPIYGDGQNIRDWLYVGDHCSGIDAVLQRGTLGETYTIGGLNEWANIDITHLICELLDEYLAVGGSSHELITFVKDRPGHDKRYAINAEKIASDLGWRPEVTFEHGIAKTLKWYLSNTDWCHRVRSGAS